MEPDIPTVASSTGVCLLVLVLMWAKFHRSPVPQSLRRTYTATATYIAETIVQPSQATHLVFPAPTLRKVREVVPTMLRDFSTGEHAPQVERVRGPQGARENEDVTGGRPMVRGATSATATRSAPGNAAGRSSNRVLRVEPIRAVPNFSAGAEAAVYQAVVPKPRFHTPSPPAAGPSRLTLDVSSAPSRSPSPLTPMSSLSLSPSPTRKSPPPTRESPPPPTRESPSPPTRETSLPVQESIKRTFSTKTEFILSLERHDHYSGTVVEDDEEVTITTYWWETSSDENIEYPLDLSCRPELQEGDLFVHRTPRRPQLWLWARSAEGALEWKNVYVGYVREDGRRLALTKKHEWPTWLEPRWFTKHKR